MTQPRLRIALQKKGRLSADSAELLRRCGVKIHLAEQKLIACAENLPIDLLRVRDDDIPFCVAGGIDSVATKAANTACIITLATPPISRTAAACCSTGAQKSNSAAPGKSSST